MSDQKQHKATPAPNVRDYATTITILEHMSDAIFILNNDGRVEYANKTALEMLELPLSDIISRPISLFISDNSNRKLENTRAVDNTVLNAMAKGQYREIETNLLGKTLNTPVVVSFGIVRNNRNEPQYIIVSAKDITLKKHLEKELREQQAMAVSRDRVRALGELAVGLVHELSQPLASLKLTTEMAMKNIQNDASKEKIVANLKAMNDQQDTVSQIVDNIRNFAYQTEDDSMRSVDLNQSLRNAINLSDYELKKRNIDLQLDVDPDLPAVNANPLNIEQVFVALFNQACAAFDKSDSSDAKMEKHMEVVMRHTAGKWVEVFVQDNSAGLDDNEQTHIFDPFYHVKEDGSAVGVGLASIRRIITSLGGDIKIKSSGKTGTLFTFRLPANQNTEREQLFNLIEMLNKES